MQELNPEYSGLNPTSLNPFDFTNVFSRSKSWVLYDKSDYRVNGELTSELVAESIPLNSTEIQDTGHLVDMSIVAKFFEWYDLTND